MLFILEMAAVGNTVATSLRLRHSHAQMKGCYLH